MAGRKSKIIICGLTIFLCSLTRVMSGGTLDIDMNGQRAALKTGSVCPYPKTVKIRLNRGNETLETLAPLSLENGGVRFKNSKGDLEGSIIPCTQGNLPAFLLKLKIFKGWHAYRH